MNRKYKNRDFQRIYDGMLRLAGDCTSELYHQHIPRRGASHRCAFWDGFDGMKRSAHAVPRTISGVCFQAGKDFARSV